MKKRPVLLLCAVAAAIAALALGAAAMRYALPTLFAQTADGPAAQSPVSEPAQSPAAGTPQPDASAPGAGPSPAQSGAPDGEMSAQPGETSSASPPEDTPSATPAPGAAVPSSPALGKPGKGAQTPAAQSTAVPAAAPAATSAAAPTATGDYTIVTGTSGEFTPGAMVSDSWFDDALFIGDSRTDGLRLYCRSGKADYFAVTGLTVFSALKKTAKDVNFSTQTLGSLLDSKTYGKILICLGLNECGSKVQSIINSYQGLVNTIQEKQPDAAVIIQGVMACGHAKADDSPNFGPQNLNRLNANIKLMAQNSGAHYIDPNTLFADSEGYLPSKFSRDGCHFYAKYYKVWVDWIKCQMYSLPVGSPAADPEPAPSNTPSDLPAESMGTETPPPSAEPSVSAAPAGSAQPAESETPSEPAQPAPSEGPEGSAPPEGPEESAPAAEGTGAGTEPADGVAA